MRRYIFLLPLFILLISTYSQSSTPVEPSELVTSAIKLFREGNYKDAIALYKQAYILGSPKAMIHLSSIYGRGKGVTKDEKLSDKYLQEAIRVYKKLASNNDGDAQFNLGIIYAARTKPPNTLEAYNWYLKAANNGHMRAQYSVGKFLDRGTLDPDVKKNPKEAIKWFEKAAEQGYEPAIKTLAKLNSVQSEVVQSVFEKNKRVNILWSTKEKCSEEGAFMIAIETHGNAYKIAACAKYGCRIEIEEFGRKTYKGNYKDDPKLIWISDTVFETKINGNNMRFYHCLTK